MNLLIRIFWLILYSFIPSSAFAQTIEGTFETPFKRYEMGEAYMGTKVSSWHACAWKGESIHRQILLWAEEKVSDLEYEIGGLTGENTSIDADHIHLRFAKYIKGDPEARSCGEYGFHGVLRQIADGLSPVAIHEIDADDPLKLWLTIEVPSEVPAGIYDGMLTVISTTQTLEFFIRLEILDYQLPNIEDQQFHLDLWQFPAQILMHHNNAHPDNAIELWSDEHFTLFAPAYQYLARMGQKAITTHIKENALGSPSMIRWIKTTNGEWDYDFSAFAKYVDSLMAWGIHKQINCFSVVGWNKNIIPFWDEATQSMMELDAPLGSTTFNERWTHFLTHFKTFLEDPGWFEKTVLYMDEVPASEMMPILDLIHGHDSNWKIGLAHGHQLSNNITDAIYDLSGILNVGSSLGRENLQTTFYTSCTQTFPNNYVSVENSPAEMVWMGWHAVHEDFDGYLRWAFDYWQLEDPFDARDGSNTAGDFSMGYRTSNDADVQFMSSIRLEMLYQGIQDFEKIRILRDTLLSQGNTDALMVLDNQIQLFTSSSGSNAADIAANAQATLQNLICETTVRTQFINRSSKVKVFPNPVKNTLYIESPADVPMQGIRILNSKGNLVNDYELLPFTTHFSLKFGRGNARNLLHHHQN